MSKKTQLGYIKQRGLGLISALFVITVLALLAAGMASLMTSAAKLHSQQVITIRANSAASSALQIYQSTLANQQQCTTDTVTYQFNTPGLYECKARVKCTNLAFKNTHYLTLEATANCGVGLDSASAQLTERLLR